MLCVTIILIVLFFSSGVIIGSYSAPRNMDGESAKRRACLENSAAPQGAGDQDLRHPPIYFEAHVTVEPVFDGGLDLFKSICAKQKFRVADLSLQKRSQDTADRSSQDAFCTGHDRTQFYLETRLIRLLADLREAGFKIWRYKIERVVLDSRQADKYGMVERKETA